MKIAIFYAHVRQAAQQTGQSLPHILSRVRAMGFSGLECDYSDICDDPQGFLAQIQQAGLQVSAVYRFFDFCSHVDTAELERFVDFCDFLGTKKILAIPGLFTPHSDREKELAEMVRGTALLCALAQKRGIAVSLEDFDSEDAPFGTAQQLLYFMRHIPQLGYTYDTGNFYYFGHDLLTAFDELRHRLVHVHCKNRALSPLNTGDEAKAALTGTVMYPAPVGVGEIPMAAALDRVLATGYDDYFTCEHFGAADQLEFMAQSAQWLGARLGLHPFAKD